MLPPTGNEGWDNSPSLTPMLYPRNDEKLPRVAKARLYSSNVVWVLNFYPLTGLVLTDSNDVVKLVLPIYDILRCDLTFDQLDRPVIVFEKAGSEVWIYKYNTISTLYDTTLLTAGTRPACCMDVIEQDLQTLSDILIFYQTINGIYYRMQRENYLTAHLIPNSLSRGDLDTCGTSLDTRLVVRLIKPS